ncbi:MAG: S-layer homology domain-containing protein, partial [Clostridia bacterium]|nr:S-layer homology domain-containing protein [Clostridia bacterium]
MKRIISLLIAVSIIIMTIPVTMALDTSAAVQDASAERIFGLGLMPHTTIAEYSPADSISRGELAWILNNIYTYRQTISNDEFAWQFYGNAKQDIEQIKTPPAAPTVRFTDVPTSYWAYDIVDDVVNAGLMNGVSASEFLPEGVVTIEQLMKCMVVLMGYESQAQYYGGYPTGYMRVASELKLLSGVNSTGNITNDDVIKVLDNALDTNLMVFDGIVSSTSGQYIVNVKSDDTFLTGILGLGMVEGVMTDNSATSLVGDSKVDEGDCVVDGILLKSPKDSPDALLGYIGRDVECYYVIGEGSKNLDRVVYAAPTGNDKATEILADDFSSYQDGTITYYEDSKEQRISLSGSYSLIYNGKALSKYTESIFDIDDGRIVVVEHSGQVGDVVIIEDYETWFVSALDSENEMFFNRLDAVSGSVAMEDYKHAAIYRADGTPGEFADISKDSVLNVARNGDVITIHICDRIETGVIEAISSSGGDEILETAENSYVVSEAYNSYKDRIDYSVGNEYTFYMNKFGKVAWITIGTEDVYRAGWVIAMTKETNLNGRLGFYIFDATDNKAYEYYSTTDKITASDSYAKETSYKDFQKFMDIHGAYRGIVRYKVNKDNALTYIEFPITDRNSYSVDNKLALICETNKSNDTYRYGNLGGKVFMDSATKVICTDPDNLDSEEGFSVRSQSATFTAQDEYTTKCYTARKDSKLAQYVVYETATKSAAIKFASSSNTPNMALVKKVLNIYDAEEGAVKAIRAFGFPKDPIYTGGAKDVDLFLREDVKITTIMSHEFKSDIEPGDIIVYGTDTDGYVTEIRVLWDENGVNPASPAGSPGALTDSKGYYGTGDDAPTWDNSNIYTGDTTKLPNPYALETTSGVDNA